ncbi:MAG TPA: hypothetical protein VJ718_08080 [Candidatus Binataceae bacterium]|nr:hypothetical protein [Candidatus Binataceae bacterium]
MKSLLSALEPILPGRPWTKTDTIASAGQRWRPTRLIEGFVGMGVDARQLASALAQLYRLPMQAQIDRDAINRGLLASMPLRYARANRLLPLASDGVALFVAVADPSNYVVLDDLGMLFQMAIRPIVVPCDVLDQAIDGIAREIEAQGVRGQILDLDLASLETAARRLSQEPSDDVAFTADSVLELVRGLIREAVNEGASDLRLEPGETDLRARYRVRELSYDLMSAPKCFQAPILACVKIMAGMNPIENNSSRQGYIATRLARRIAGIMVSVANCAAGESVVLGVDGHRLRSAGPRNGGAVVKDTSPFEAFGRLPTELPRCPECGETMAVKDALFCKACGSGLFALSRDRLSLDSGASLKRRLAVRNEWRLY